MVDFVDGCIDEGNAPEFNVCGVSSIERISEGQMRVTYYRCRKGEKIVVAHCVWDRETWLKMWKFWHDQEHNIRSKCFEMEVDDGIRRELN